MIFTKLYQPEKSQSKYREESSFSRPRPRAYFLNGPNATATVAATFIRHALSVVGVIISLDKRCRRGLAVFIVNFVRLLIATVN